jgi:hypothetical protein
MMLKTDPNPALLSELLLHLDGMVVKRESENAEI